MSDKAMINAFSASDMAGLDQDERAMIERRQRVLGSAYRLFYERPVEFVRGEGAWLFDRRGEAYLDAYNNVAVVGHANARVAEAMAAQARRLNTHTRYLSKPILDYAEQLLGHFPAPLSQIIFTCTGSEANDLAYRMACQMTGGTGVIVTDLAYHGVTQAVSAFSPSFGKGLALGQHVRTVPAPRGEGDVAARFGNDVRIAAADLLRHGVRPAMLIVDTIFSSDGVIAAPAGFLGAAVEAIHAAGGLFVADEVQAGFGRTGEAMWGFARHGIAPDLVTLGKPMGNGYPIAGLVGRPDIFKAFGDQVRYFNTFGGTPVAIAAAQAVLDIIEADGLAEKALGTGRQLVEGFAGIAKTSGVIGEVRGAGLFLGVDIVDPATGKADALLAGRIVNAMRERRVLISATGPEANVLKIRPPLVFGPAEAEQFLTTLSAVLRDIPAGQ